MKRVVVTRTGKVARPPRVYAHRWKGHQLANVEYLHEHGHGPSDIAELLAIPLDCIKYVLYKKPKRPPARRAAARAEREQRAKLHKPRGW